MFYFAIFLAANAFATTSSQPAAPSEETASQSDSDEPAESAAIEQNLPEGSTEDSAAIPVVATPAERLAEGWERVRRGDYVGGKIMADQVLQMQDAEEEEEALYLKAFSQEWGGTPELALPLFEEIIARWPEGRYFRDSLFRKTESLGKLGRYEEALRLLSQHFESDKDLSLEDQLKVDLLKGIWLVERGKEQPGTRKIYKALVRDATDEVSWYQAQAISVLVRALMTEIEKGTLHGGTNKMRKQLTTLAALMSTAESLLRRTIELAEPAWIIEQLHSIGTGYLVLGDHLRDAPVGSLDEIQLAAYKQEIRTQIETVYIKGLKHFELGLEHADRVQWSGEAVEDLRAARGELAAKIEAL